MKLSQDLKFAVAEAAFGVVPEELTEEQEYELEHMGKDVLWKHVCGDQDAVELHDLHQEIYRQELDMMDTMWKIIVTKIPNLNIDFMNILAATGRVDELNEYLKKLL